MSDTPDTFMMIGLHKLAAERNDGLIPELLALYAAQASRAAAAPSEWPDKPEAKSKDISTMPAGNDNVIPFRPYFLARRRR